MIVFRYIFKETLKTQLSILLVLLLIFTSQQFIRILSRAADGSVPTSLIGQLMLLNIPYMGLLLLPISLFIAILFAHGRLYADSEMTVLRAIGVGIILAQRLERMPGVGRFRKMEFIVTSLQLAFSFERLFHQFEAQRVVKQVGCRLLERILW